MKPPYFSVVVFTYNRASLLRDCITSILSQSFLDFELIVSDNCSDDNTEEVSRSFGDERIRYFRNESNLGLRGNLEAGTSHAVGEIVFLMGDDDILLQGALWLTRDAFQMHQEIGLVTRPYYWFMESSSQPVRAVLPFDKNTDTVVTVDSDRGLIRALFATAGQISGLAFRRTLIRVAFHPDIFTTHLYLFADLLKQRPALILRDFTVAVRIGESMCRHNPEIYEKSPTESWMEMFRTIYPEPRFNRVLKLGKDMMAAHCEGFIQIRNYGTLRQLIREILVQVKYRPRNLVSPRFLAYALICLLMPPRFLAPLTDFYKRNVLARRISLSTKPI
jgi:glycosyltransferase involved in cell wall biosynthesis